MEKQFVLKAKTAVKRVAAISAGATMMGATMMGAVAADLGDYPSPFVSKGELNGLVVVGSTANAGDIVGAGDLISTLTQATVSAASGTTVTEGGEDIEVALDAPFTAASYDDEDIAGLLDDEVDFNDTTYTYKEEIFVGAGLQILTSADQDEEDFGANAYLGTTSASTASFGYHFVFDDDISALEDGGASAVTSDDSLTIPFLGSTIELTDLQDDNTITFNLATEYTLNVGESATINGKTLTLVNTGSSNVVVDVDGVSDIVGTTSTETVNGVKVKVDAIFDADSRSERSAVILAGDDISQTVEDGDVFEMFGLSDDSDENPWEWDIDLSTMSTEGVIGVQWSQQSDELGDDYPPYAMGDRLSLPNDYGYVVFDSYTSNDYLDLTITFAESKTIENAGREVIRFQASNDDGFSVVDASDVSEEIDEVYFFQNATNFYWAWKPEGEDWSINAADDADVEVKVQYDNEDTIAITFVNDSAVAADYAGNLTFTFGTYGDVPELNFNATEDGNNDLILGTAEDEEADEVYVGTDNVGTKDYDLLFTGGMILRNPESNGNGDGQIQVSYPSEAMDANVIVAGPGTSTTSTEYSSVTVNSVAGQSVIKLDTEVTDPASRNLILVGGPAVNRLTAQAMNLAYPTGGADSGIPEGAALIRLVENAFGGSNSALVVAGWDAEDTRAATSVLQNYRSYANSLDGRMEVQVSGTSVTAVGGDVATE